MKGIVAFLLIFFYNFAPKSILKNETIKDYQKYH